MERSGNVVVLWQMYCWIRLISGTCNCGSERMDCFFESVFFFNLKKKCFQYSFRV